MTGGLIDFDAAEFDAAIFGGSGDFARVFGEVHHDVAKNQAILTFSIVP